MAQVAGAEEAQHAVTPGCLIVRLALSTGMQALSLAADPQPHTVLVCCADVTSHKFQNLPQKLAEHACSLHLTDLSFR